MIRGFSGRERWWRVRLGNPPVASQRAPKTPRTSGRRTTVRPERLSHRIAAGAARGTARRQRSVSAAEATSLRIDFPQRNRAPPFCRWLIFERDRNRNTAPDQGTRNQDRRCVGSRRKLRLGFRALPSEGVIAAQTLIPKNDVLGARRLNGQSCKFGVGSLGSTRFFSPSSFGGFL